MGQISRQELNQEVNNELDKITVLTQDLGDKNALNTTDKTDVVAGINEVNSNLMIVEKKTSQEVSVLEFGADPTGMSPSTQAFIDCAIYCDTNNKNMLIPDGNFWINGSIPFPNYYTVKGNGFGTNIIVDLPEGEFVWKEDTDFRYGWGIEDMRFTLKSGANKNVGGIYIESSLRGSYIRNIWSYELRRPIYLGDKIWGIISIENLFLYLLNENLDMSITEAAFSIKGNTIMMSNIEIIGGWNKGLHLQGVTVFKLNGYNISGSSSAIQILQPIYIENSDSGEITSGWIEQLVDNSTSANGRPIYGNGHGEAIYIKNSKAIKIGESNISSGSIFVDNSNITVDEISYSQSNAGLRTLNNSKVNATESALKFQNINADYKLADGEINLNTYSTQSIGLIDNPILKTGIPHSLATTNGSLVTLTNELIDYISGDRAIKVNITASYQGVNINKNNLKIGKIYTAVLKVKKVSGLDWLYVSPTSGASSNTKYPSTLTRSGETDYHTLSYVFTATSTNVVLKLQGVLKSNESQGIFLVDAVDILEGYCIFDPSLQNQATLSEQGRLKASSIPTQGSWDLGNKVITNTPIASGYLGWVCTAGGSPGTWKGFGLIEA